MASSSADFNSQKDSVSEEALAKGKFCVAINRQYCLDFKDPNFLHRLIGEMLNSPSYRFDSEDYFFDLEEAKHKLYSAILRIAEPKIRQRALAQSLLPDTCLGSFFRLSRGMRETDISRGTLNKIASALQEEETIVLQKSITCKLIKLVGKKPHKPLNAGAIYHGYNKGTASSTVSAVLALMAKANPNKVLLSKLKDCFENCTYDSDQEDKEEQSVPTAQFYFERANKRKDGNRVDDLTNAVSYKPDYALAYICRGKEFLKAGKTEAAIKDIDEACRINPHITEFPYYGLFCFSQGKKFLEVEKKYDNALFWFVLATRDDKRYFPKEMMLGFLHIPVLSKDKFKDILLGFDGDLKRELLATIKEMPDPSVRRKMLANILEEGTFLGSLFRCERGFCKTSLKSGTLLMAREMLDEEDAKDEPVPSITNSML